LSESELRDDSNISVAAAYNAIADDYAKHFHKELDGKPLNLTFYRHEIATIRARLESAGFTIWMETVREPDRHERARQAYLIVQRAECDLAA
jgi:hypothetical protein